MSEIEGLREALDRTEAALAAVRDALQKTITVGAGRCPRCGSPLALDGPYADFQGWLTRMGWQGAFFEDLPYAQFMVAAWREDDYVALGVREAEWLPAAFTEILERIERGEVRHGLHQGHAMEVERRWQPGALRPNDLSEREAPA